MLFTERTRAHGNGQAKALGPPGDRRTTTISSGPEDRKRELTPQPSQAKNSPEHSSPGPTAGGEGAHRRGLHRARGGARPTPQTEPHVSPAGGGHSPRNPCSAFCVEPLNPPRAPSTRRSKQGSSPPPCRHVLTPSWGKSEHQASASRQGCPEEPPGRWRGSQPGELLGHKERPRRRFAEPRAGSGRLLPGPDHDGRPVRATSKVLRGGTCRPPNVPGLARCLK